MQGLPIPTPILRRCSLPLMCCFLLMGIAGLLLFVVPSTASQKQPANTKAKGLPKAFVAVDTSELLGSPDPFPLEARRVFPRLKFDRPVELTFADDGSDRLFVVEQRGVIRVFENKPDAAEASMFLDLTDVVLSEGYEQGLLGLAFHPQYKTNRQFFVSYTAQKGTSVISRFLCSPDDPKKALRQSEEVLLKVDQPYANHNGGSICFGPDGYLYIGFGDGGLADDPHLNAQNLETLLGSILRIDVNHKDENLAYAVPEDNPFTKRKRARGEIWAYGLRNPWRLAFDRKTGQLWTGDVGQNRYEEVNRIVRGGNYGWSLREGFHDFNPNTPAQPHDLIDPISEYFRGEGISVTGGKIYRGQKLKEFQGAYFYGDFGSGNVWAISHATETPESARKVARTALPITAFGEDRQGEIYLCTYDGEIYQLEPPNEDIKALAEQFPRKLSETGLFASVAENIPAEGLIPYEVNVPFWSDYAVKDRYIALPKAGSVTFHPQDKWEFPVGTVFVKTFWLHQDRTDFSQPKRLETRLLVHSPRGWDGYTYLYDDDETEASLLPGSEHERADDDAVVPHSEGGVPRPVSIKTAQDKVQDQHYYFPSRIDCLACHTKGEGFVLGLNTRQMNRTLRYQGEEENQIELFNRLGVFRNPVDRKSLKDEKFPDWGFGNLKRDSVNGDSQDDAGNQAAIPDENAELFARAWLDVNCAMCHRPQGIAPGPSDFRFHVPLEKMGLVNQPAKQGHLSAPGKSLVIPGAPLESELVLRISHRGPRQMPPLATNLIDERGVESIKRWIANLKAEE